MKKLLSVVLSLVALMSLTLTAFAASVSATPSAATVEKGEQVTVKVTLDEAIADITSFEYYLTFDETKFEVVSATASTAAHANMNVSLRPSGEYTINCINLSGDGLFSMAAGELATFVFEAKENVTGTGFIKLESQGIYDVNWNDKTTTPDVVVNVEVVAPTATPEPTPTPVVTPEPTPEPTPVVTPEPTPVVTPEPTPVVTPEPTAAPTAEPTAAPAPAPTAGPTSPDTSDGTMAGLWMMVTVASAAMLVVTFFVKKKADENN